MPRVYYPSVNVQRSERATRFAAIVDLLDNIVNDFALSEDDRAFATECLHWLADLLVVLREQASAGWSSTFQAMLVHVFAYRVQRSGFLAKSLLRDDEKCVACGRDEHRNGDTIDLLGDDGFDAMDFLQFSTLEELEKTFKRYLGDVDALFAISDDGLAACDAGAFTLGKTCTAKTTVVLSAQLMIFDAMVALNDGSEGVKLHLAEKMKEQLEFIEQSVAHSGNVYVYPFAIQENTWLSVDLARDEFVMPRLVDLLKQRSKMALQLDACSDTMSDDFIDDDEPIVFTSKRRRAVVDDDPSPPPVRRSARIAAKAPSTPPITRVVECPPAPRRPTARAVAQVQRMPDRLASRKLVLSRLMQLQADLHSEDRNDDATVVTSAILTLQELLPRAN